MSKYIVDGVHVVCTGPVIYIVGKMVSEYSATLVCESLNYTEEEGPISDIRKDIAWLE